eukprot:TRINITY_DN16485_c0_g1_i1.p1 TRINITY_DN16485_c0_g1~~TRINITY_DN16485_c0_g1_i1.p1  ORF type:complete len:440 (-),score=97.93 TRINITY_DN16485_c0_g1_i1:411-1730(-)
MPVQESTTTIRLAQREANHARSRYDGEISISTGQREGKGKFFYANPYFVYEGDWLAGKKHGHGRLSFDGGGFYEGHFEEGEITGRGIQEWRDGSSYDGQFLLGLKHGKGTWEKADGTHYVGGFQQGRYAGQGKLTLPNGDKYTGDFAGHKYHGDGSLDQPKQDMSYQGQFNMGLRHGEGTLHELGGAAVYMGQFQSGMKHGQGKAVDEASGISYEGAWVEDRPAQFAAAFDLSPAESQESFVPASELLREEAANQLNGVDPAKDKKGKKAAKAPSPEPVDDVGPQLKGTRGQALPEIAVRLTDVEKAVVTAEIGRQLRVSVYKEQKSTEDPEQILRNAVKLGDQRQTEEESAQPPKEPAEAEEGAEPEEPICEGSETVDGAISEAGHFLMGGSDAWLLPVYLQPAIYFIRVEDITELPEHGSSWTRMEPLEIPFKVVDP